MDDSFEKFLTDTCKPIWHLAYAAGEEARKNGLPRACNLEGPPYCHNGSVLKVYRSAWEQGWDRHSIPAEFGHVEAALGRMPLRPLEMDDLL